MGDIHEIINIELPSQSARVQRGGEGPPLLFLHAEANTSAWSNFHDELAENFEVFAPIHPGFGGEETPNWLTDVTAGGCLGTAIVILEMALLERAAQEEAELIQNSGRAE